MTPAKGTILNDRYALTDRIAAGGMGEVWAATDTVLGRPVAVKFLHPALSQDSGLAERFRAEARHTAGLHHPNITTVFDFGQDGSASYLVMELVAGQPLSAIISERAPLSARETSSILMQAAKALEAAHQGGVVHRDVKPANILITPDGTAKLTDFGISRVVDAAPLTQTGQILGTAQYLSPEQAMGRSATASSDLYALGVVGHEMLTGQRPFDAGTAVATALAHLNQPPPPLPDTVPAGLREVIGAALAKNPADRPVSAAAMVHALGMPDVASVSGAGGGLAPTLALHAAPLATSIMPALATTQALPAVTQQPSRQRWAWLLGAFAMFGILAFFLLSNLGAGGSGKTPAVTSITSSSPSPSATTPGGAIPPAGATPTKATPRASAAVVAPPTVTSPVPNADNKRRGKGKDTGEGNENNNRGGER